MKETFVLIAVAMALNMVGSLMALWNNARRISDVQHWYEIAGLALSAFASSLLVGLFSGLSGGFICEVGGPDGSTTVR